MNYHYYYFLSVLNLFDEHYLINLKFKYLNIMVCFVIILMNFHFHFINTSNHNLPHQIFIASLYDVFKKLINYLCHIVINFLIISIIIILFNISNLLEILLCYIFRYD